MSGMFKKPDTSAAERQLAESRAENERMRSEAEAERRDLAQQAESRRRARLRGGSRMLLSQARVAPEVGIETLGAMGVERTA
jgi:sRNA-binding protein